MAKSKERKIVRPIRLGGTRYKAGDEDALHRVLKTEDAEQHVKDGNLEGDWSDGGQDYQEPKPSGGTIQLAASAPLSEVVSQPDTSAQEALALREQGLADREQALAQRESALAAREQSLAEREAALVKREAQPAKPAEPDKPPR